MEKKPTEKLRRIYDKRSGWWAPETFIAIHQILIERGERVAELPDEEKTAPYAANQLAAREQDRSAMLSDDPIKPSEMREFMRSVNRSQDEHLRVLSSIRWAIVGFSIWFIVQFWFLPKL